MAEYGLTESAVRDAVRKHCDFSQPLTDGGAAPMPTDQSRQINELVDIIQYLIATGDAPSRDLYRFFNPQRTRAKSQGRLVEGQQVEWFQSVIAPRLRSLPFIVENDTCEFDLDPDDYDDEHLQPLDEIRSGPETVAEQRLDDIGVPRDASQRDEIVIVLKRPTSRSLRARSRTWAASRSPNPSSTSGPPPRTRRSSSRPPRS